jgi:hypothetical protein
MGIGHLAVGFAAKRAVPRVPLALLVLAAIFVDVLWGAAVLLGIEHARVAPGITKAMPFDLYDYPYTHSLLAGIFWSLVFGGIYFLLNRYRAGAVMLGALVLSHFVLDVISHRPDMPIFFNGPYIGLGLWNSVPASIIVEEAMAIAGLVLYLRATRARNPGGCWGLAAFAVFMLAMGVVGYLAPPPPSVKPLAAGNLLSLVFVLVLHLIDKQREPVKLDGADAAG